MIPATCCGSESLLTFLAVRLVFISELRAVVYSSVQLSLYSSLFFQMLYLAILRTLLQTGESGRPCSILPQV